MFLLVIDFTYWEGRDGEIVSRSWRLLAPNVKVFHHISLRDRTAGGKYEILKPE